MLFELPNTSIPAPSPEAVEYIIEAIELLEKGDREKAARTLEISFQVSSPILYLAAEMRFLNDQIASGKKGSLYQPDPTRFDWVHYAVWAVRLRLVDMITNSDMLEAIDVVRPEPSPMESSPALTARYTRFSCR